MRSEIQFISVAMAQEIQTNLIHYFRSCLSFCSLPPLPLFQFRPPPTLPGTMDTLANTLREWLSMHFENGNRLVWLLHIICFILENVLDEFSGRHWAFLCSTIHGAFQDISNRYPIFSFLTLPPLFSTLLVLSIPSLLIDSLKISPSSTV